MSKPGHSLVSDVTPWWWGAQWGRSDVKRAVVALLTTKKFSIERIEISRDALQVKLALGENEDINRTQERVDALRDALNAIVAA